MANLSNINNKFLVTTGGNVGIGVTGPTAKLHIGVSSANDDTFHIFNGSVRTHLLGSESSNGVIYLRSSANSNKVRINTSGDSYFNGGNVGIGTDSPSSLVSSGNKLVVGDGTVSQGITIYTDTSGNGNLYFADGTTGDEAYRGFLRYSHSNDSMQFYTAGVNERMRIDSSGNVGIGEASPDSLLTVGGDFTATTAKPTVSVSDMTNGGSLGIRGLSPILAFDKTASGVPKILMDGGGLEFKNGTLDSQGSVDLKIDSSGNVGIGKTTSLTSHRLSILKGGSNQQLGLYYDETNVAMFGARSNGDAQIYAWNGSSYRNILLGVDGSATGGNVGIGVTFATAKLQIHNTNGGAAAVAAYLVNASTSLNTETRLAFAAHTNDDIATNRYSYISTINTSGSNGQDMIFATNATGASAVERMRIDSAGNVGIGTSSPDVPLDVQGAIQASESGGDFIRMQTDGTNNIFDVNSGAYVFRTSGFSERMRIDSSGNVGIGTTNPTAPLMIAGSGADGTAMLRLEATAGTQAFNWISSAVYPNMTADKTAIKLFGQAQSTNNQAWIGFKYAGSGSTNNQLSFGFYANNFLLNIKANGNVGIGTESPTYKFEVSNGTITGTFNPNSSGFMFLGSISNHPLYFGVNDSTKMVINSSGNVGIGTTSPDANLEVIDPVSGNFSGEIRVGGTGSSRRLLLKQDTVLEYLIGASGENALLKFGTGTGATERMRIDSLGNVDIANATTGNAGTRIWGGSDGGIIYMYRPINQGTQVMRFYVGSTSVGYIGTSNSGAAFTSNSDYRLKENVVELTGALDRISELKPSRFNFIVEPNKTVDGFLAHEVQDIVPEAVFGEKDAVDEEGNPDYQAMEQSKLVPLLVAAIQELKADNDSLKARIETLENN